MKREIAEVVNQNVVAAVHGGRDVLIISNADHLISDLVKLFKELREPEKNKTLEETVTRIIATLNEEWGSGFRPTTEANRRSIRARLNDGHSEDDVNSVIKYMGTKWGNDPRMSQYLRPITVFSPSKFEGYLSSAKTREVLTVQDMYGKTRQITREQLDSSEKGFYRIIK